MSHPTLTRTNLKGTWGTLLLPLNADESIDYDRLDEELDAILRGGVAGIYSNGSAGEFYAQSHEEYLEVNTRMARACRAADVPFQVGASHPCPQETLVRLKAARHLEPDAYQVILPDWFVVRGEEVFTFLERVCEEAGDAGVVLYNPPHAKRQLSPEEFGALTKRFPKLLGIKVAGGDEKWYEAMREHCEDLSIFIPGHFLATGLAQGGHGAYSNVACIDPECSVKWNNIILSDPERGMAIQNEIVGFMQKHMAPLIQGGHVNAAADKLLAAVGGWARVGTRLRWPYRWVPEEEVARYREAAYAEMPGFFALKE